MRRLPLLACLLAPLGSTQADVAGALAQVEATAAREEARQAGARAWLAGDAERRAALRDADDSLRGLLGSALGPDSATLGGESWKKLDLGALRNALAGQEAALGKLPGEADLEAARKKLKQAVDAVKIRIATLEKEAATGTKAPAKDASKRQPKLLAATMETRGAVLDLGQAAEACRARVERLALESGQAAAAARRQTRLIKPPSVDKPAAPSLPPPR